MGQAAEASRLKERIYKSAHLDYEKIAPLLKQLLEHKSTFAAALMDPEIADQHTDTALDCMKRIDESIKQLLYIE